MSESAEKTKRLAMVLKFMGAALAALAGPVGAWYTATAQSRADLEAGYEALAESVSDLKRAVDLLQANERQIWRREIEKSEKKEAKPEIEEIPASRPRAPRTSRPVGAVSIGAGAGEKPEKVAPATAPVSYEVRQAPADLEEAIKRAAK